jgi:hypothetical protein
MKTNQLMSVAFPQGTLEIFHKTAMGNLTDLFSLGNKQRGKDDNAPVNMTLFLKSKSTEEFISALSEELGIDKNDVIKRKGRGRNSKTYAQLHFLIYCAEKLSPRFHVRVIDTFISHNILQIRDDGGNAFKALNVAIDAYLPEREGKESNRGIYIQCAKLLRDKVFFDKDIDYPKDGLVWNSDYATYDKLQLRDKYEEKLITLLEMGVVRNYEHLKEFIEKLK